MKTCAKCKQTKPLDEFCKNKARADGLHHSCRACKRADQAEWYQKHKKEHRAKVIIRTKEQEELGRKLIRQAKAKPCADCGVQYPHYVMDFDHLPEFEKLKNVSNMLRHSLEALQKEIDKCEVVCSNCHRVRTFERLTAVAEMV